MSTDRQRVTLAEVSRLAGVSPAAASMALNDRPGVSASTRTRVRAAARRLGYRDHGRGAGLLGVVPTDLTNAYHTDVIAGIEERAAHDGLGVVIAHGRRDRAVMEQQLRRLVDLGVDGIVAATSWLSPEAVEAAAASVPLVVIGRMQDAVTGADEVCGDDALGGALAVRHLVGTGHQRLAFVTASTRPGPSQRRAGFLREVAAHGLRERARVIGPEALDEGVDLLLQEARRGASEACTGVLAANDVVATRVLGRAAELGVRVPEQLSVIGYDSSALALTVTPRLSSISQPRTEMGQLAARLLQERMGGRHEDRRCEVAPSLRVRDSTAPGPERGPPAVAM